MNKTITFFLMPDKSASRKMRKVLAHKSGRLNVLVGTFSELLQYAADKYLISISDTDWYEEINKAMESQNDAFYSQSFRTAPKETCFHIADDLAYILDAQGPELSWNFSAQTKLSERLSGRLHDLNKLWKTSGNILPLEQEKINALLSADKGTALNSISVIYSQDWTPLSKWQKALVEKLNRDCIEDHNQDDFKLLDQAFSNSPSLRKCRLTHVQTRFNSDFKDVEDTGDDSLIILGCRDYQEEVEIVAQLIQSNVSKAGDTCLKKCAVLLPKDVEYYRKVKSIFEQIGIPLSGLPIVNETRNFLDELLSNFIHCLKGPAPTVALASLVLSPLMPWSKQRALELADTISSGLRIHRKEDDYSDLLLLLDDLKKGVEDRAKTLIRFVITLEEYHPDSNLVEKIKVRAFSIVPLLGGDKINWREILSNFDSTSDVSTEVHSDSQEGIAIFLENEHPWRTVDTLYILGFTEGHYPYGSYHERFVKSQDLQELEDNAGWRFKSVDKSRKQQLSILKHQLNSAREQVVITVPLLDSFGNSLKHSEALAVLARLFQKKGSPDKLISILAYPEVRNSLPLFTSDNDLEPVPPRELVSDDLSFGKEIDLRRLRLDSNNTPKPESPSGIETLCTSPLAWLLNRSGAEAKGWATDQLGPIEKGTIAHAVFEVFFSENDSLPTSTDIQSRLHDVFDEVLAQEYPVFLNDHWTMDRLSLRKEIEIAALGWLDILEQLKAKVYLVESKLSGHLENHPISGRVDVIVTLPDNRVLVVDYKKQKSDTKYHTMKKSFESQTSLYRLMLKEDRQGLPVSNDIGVAYYAMNDQKLITDVEGWMSHIARTIEVPHDVSSNAMDLIKTRLEELRQGIIRLNRESDEQTIKNERGTTPYALENSPLIRIFRTVNEEIL